VLVDRSKEHIVRSHDVMVEPERQAQVTRAPRIERVVPATDGHGGQWTIGPH
jgi:hypothetical protein